MAVYVPMMEKTKSTFFSDVQNGFQIISNLCEKFEYDLNILSYSLVKSISHISQTIGYQVNEPELIQISNSFQSYLTIAQNNFNDQLKSIINQFHLLKNDYASHITRDINIINEGIKQTLMFQVKFKKMKKTNSFLNFFQLFKEEIKRFRDQLNNLREEIQHIQNSFFHSLEKYKERNKKIINSMKNETEIFIEKKQNFEKENNEKIRQKFKANTNDNNNYYLLINNIENETEILNKLKLKFENEIKILNDKNNEERKRYIDSFKKIHDKICQNMDEVNSLHNELEQLRKLNEKKENEIRLFYESEEKKFKEKHQKILLIKNEIQLLVNKVNNEDEIEYLREVKKSQQLIENERQKEEIEIKKLENFLNTKHQKFLNEIVTSHQNNSIQHKMEIEYETKFNEYLKQLSSPVFSTAIGYEKSQDITNLLARKDSLMNNISNERTHLITKSKSEIVPKNSLFKYQNLKPNFFVQISNEEKDLLKKLWNFQIESATKIRTKMKEKQNEIRKIRKDLNLTKRVYLTKKLYLMDEFNSFDFSIYTDQLKNDEKIDHQIDNLEDKIFINLIEFQTKNNWNNKRIKQLENELDRLNDSFNRAFDKLYKIKKSSIAQNKDQKQKVAQNQKNENLTRNIIRAKSSQSPNLISPVSTKIAKVKKNFAKPL